MNHMQFLKESKESKESCLQLDAMSTLTNAHMYCLTLVYSWVVFYYCSTMNEYNSAVCLMNNQYTYIHAQFRTHIPKPTHIHKLIYILQPDTVWR